MVLNIFVILHHLCGNYYFVIVLRTFIEILFFGNELNLYKRVDRIIIEFIFPLDFKNNLPGQSKVYYLLFM